MMEDMGNTSGGGIIELFPSRESGQDPQVNFTISCVSGLSDQAWAGRAVIVRSERAQVL